MRGFSGSFLAQRASPFVSNGWGKAERKAVAGKASARKFKITAAPPAARPTGEPKNMDPTAPAKPADWATVPMGLAVMGSKFCNDGIIACISMAAWALEGWFGSSLGTTTL